ncbi:MAG: DUF692 domain-containing protein [Pseudomonadales bacterium]|nr:DUF692 domain-containing protein [Pseudomonadales bacterium]NRA16155.1 DUF692 domain-containing protein [Oceanospirillaceae bacterium]
MLQANANIDLSDSRSIAEHAIGIGLRSPHHQQIVEQRPQIDWLEVHSENFFTEPSAQRRVLDQLAVHYPLSFHGIGLSLGSTDPLNKKHLQQMKALIDCYQPALISEHLSWSSNNSRYFNDLLPVPYTQESLDIFCDRLNQVQDFLGRALLVENPTTYLAFSDSSMHEWEFLNEIQRRCQCGLLLDLNNIYVNSINLGLDAKEYLQQIEVDAVQEIHLAGFTRRQLENGQILIDTHGSRVSEPVWQLFRDFRRSCNAPALIEWDTDIPALEELLSQAELAKQQQAVVSKEQIG